MEDFEHPLDMRILRHVDGIVICERALEIAIRCVDGHRSDLWPDSFEFEKETNDFIDSRRCRPDVRYRANLMGVVMRPAVALCLVAFAFTACSAPSEYAMPPLEETARAQVEQLEVRSEGGAPGMQSGLFQGPGVAQNIAQYMSATSVGTAPGDWLGSLAAGAFLIIGIPIVAIVSAASAPSAEEIKKAEESVRSTLSDPYWAQKIRENVAAAVSAGGKTVVSDGTPAAGWAILTLTLDGPVLDVAQEGGQPFMTVHGELKRGDTCLADRYWSWNGAEDEFFDLADKQSKALKKQLESGANQLAAAIADDLFFSKAARKVAYKEGADTTMDWPLMRLEPHRFENSIATWDGVNGRFNDGIPCGKPPGTAPGGMPPAS